MMAVYTWVVALLFIISAVTGISNNHLDLPLSRPDLVPFPYHPTKAFPESPLRWKACWVPSSGKRHFNDQDCEDDAPAILRAFEECNHGGVVVLAEDYMIKSPLDLTFLDAVDVIITGTISFSSNIPYWLQHSFYYTYQEQITWWRFGGKDVNIYGGGRGTLNGNGQPWFDAFGKNDSLLRPILFVMDGMEGGSVTGLNMRQSPEWFNFIANSTDIFISDITIFAESNDSTPAVNGDGWDIYRSSNVVIQNSHIQNTDDCVSFKPNCTDILVQNLVCNGSHGISVGSLGQYPAEFDIVQNVYVFNTSMSDAQNGARIKVWPGSNTPFQPTLSGGGGSGYVNNITYEGFYNHNTDWAITIDQCYGQSNQTICDEYPSNMTIGNVLFKDFTGTTSSANDPDVGTLVCSSEAKCTNIRAQDINVSPPSGKKADWICVNMDDSLLDINCVWSSSS